MGMLHINSGILGNPALIIGFMTFVGLVALRKSMSEGISGTWKTILGFVILLSGASTVAIGLKPFGAMFQTGLHLQGVIPTNEAIAGLAQMFGGPTAIIMGLGVQASWVTQRQEVASNRTKHRKQYFGGN